MDEKIAMQTAGHAVLFSGVTVAIGLLALVVLPVPFMRSMGYGGALIPLASVLTTLTLTPAILGGIGPRVDWPRVRHENKPSRGWASWATRVVRHRVIAAVVAFVVLGALFASFVGVKIGLAGSDSLAQRGPAFTAFQQLKTGGGSTGWLTPMQVVTTERGASKAATELGRVDGVQHTVVSTDAANVANGQTVVM